MFAGVAFPDMGKYFQPYPLYGMMFLLFLSFLSLDIASVGKALKRNASLAAWLIFVKVLLIPVFVFFIFKFLPFHANVWSHQTKIQSRPGWRLAPD